MPLPAHLPAQDGLHPASLPGLFIADLHLSADRPHAMDAFLGFLSGPARQAGSLFILGDLFDSWAGDDDVDSPFNSRICDVLRATAARGTSVFFINGNRDVLIGEGFARAANVRLLPDPSLIRLGARALLLSHGDVLCTDDHAYQSYRQQVHNPAWQAEFLAHPLTVRHDFIKNLRSHSEAAKRAKSMDVMDVNADAVASLLRAHDYPTLIHGHTHRTGQHLHTVDGHACARHVLADWHEHPVWLACDGETLSAHG